MTSNNRWRKGNWTRRVDAYSLAEFAPSLLIAFTIVVFPLLAIGTLGTRYLFLINAARLAAQSASRCQTFLSNIPNPGAVKTALVTSKNAINGIGGGTVTWLSTDTYIYVCPLGSTTYTTPGANQKLPAPASGNSSTYNCVVNIHATMQPIFPGFSSLVGAIPGLNANIDAYAKGENYFENTGNLNQ